MVDANLRSLLLIFWYLVIVRLSMCIFVASTLFLFFFSQSLPPTLIHRQVLDELNKMRMKEKYLNNQHNAMGLAFIEVGW